MVQAKRVLAAAFQSMQKDTLIGQLEDRISGLHFVIREAKIKDSATVVGHKREMDISDNAKQAAIDEVGKKTRELKWANVKKDLWKGTAIAAIIYAAVKTFGK